MHITQYMRLSPLFPYISPYLSAQGRSDYGQQRGVVTAYGKTKHRRINYRNGHVSDLLARTRLPELSIPAADFFVNHLHDQRVLARLVLLQLAVELGEFAGDLAGGDGSRFVIEQLLGPFHDGAEGDV